MFRRDLAAVVTLLQGEVGGKHADVVVSAAVFRMLGRKLSGTTRTGEFVAEISEDSANFTVDQIVEHTKGAVRHDARGELVVSNLPIP